MVLNILFLTGRELDYPRNSIFYKGLIKNDAKVTLCTSKSKNYFFRHISVITQFLLKKRKEHDVIFIGLLGHLLVPIVKIFSRKPVVFDIFFSLSETLAERGIIRENSILSKIPYFFDWFSCKLADRILCYSNSEADFISNLVKLPRAKFKRIFVGADTEIYYPMKSNNKKFSVFCASTYLKVHGMEYIIKAAKLLENHKDIGFILVGNGPLFKQDYELSKKLKLKNIEFLDFMPQSDLAKQTATCDLGIGMMGLSKRADRSISNKVYQLLASRKPIIAGDTPANRELLKYKESIYFCEKGNPRSLAEAIIALKENEKLRKKLADNGYNTFMKNCTPEKIGKQFKKILESVI